MLKGCTLQSIRKAGGGPELSALCWGVLHSCLFFSLVFALASGNWLIGEVPAEGSRKALVKCGYFFGKVNRSA